MNQSSRHIMLSMMIGLFLLGLLYVPGLLGFSWLARLESESLDQRFALRGPQSPHPDIVIVAIDSASKIAFDRPASTWNPLHAEMVRALANASAACVFFDLNWDRRFDPLIREMVASQGQLFGLAAPPKFLSGLGFDTPLIKAFLETRKSLKVILGYFFHRYFQPGIYQMFRVHQLAYVNIRAEEDQMTRRLPLFAFDKNQIFPSVTLAVGSAMASRAYSLNPDGSMLFGDQPIPCSSREHEVWVNYSGPDKTFPRLSYQDILHESRTNPEKLARLQGKTVLIGLAEFDDIKNTSFGKMPGIEVHANAIDNLVRGRFLRKSPEGLEPLILFLFWISLTLGFARNSALGSLFAVLLPAGWLIACQSAFQQAVILPLSGPMIFALGFGLLQGFSSFYLLKMESKKIRNLFRRYVNDSIIQEVLRNPHQVMEGKRCDICVLFADIRGFTAYAEKRDPHEVVCFLNGYFEQMTDIVLRHHGVVDKFLGDGLMAFFNAPIERPLFLQESVQAALEIRQFTEKAAIPSGDSSFVLKVGMALHVGEALVGNVGSERKMEFTAIGDTVNTSSRLETLNKEYNTDIIVSEKVALATKEQFNWKSLGHKAIRGKEQPMELFTLLGPRENTTQK